MNGLRREADIVFPSAKAAVFVDGCFWHGCPEHATHPKRNAAFWTEKILRNQTRDQETDSLLTEAGWCAIRVWEHEDPDQAAERIAGLVRKLVGERTDFPAGS
ncbi:MAG: mismatch endonuclease, patch repair protein [Gaiellales bacterium]|nr:mismatch endonuclease, patch repair protein [Gaiellales bacterium]